MTAIKTKRLIKQLMLSALVLICVSQPIFAKRKATQKKIKNVIIELNIDKFLENKKLKLPWNGGIGGSYGSSGDGDGSSCTQCVKQEYFYSFSAEKLKNGGATVYLQLGATFSDGQGLYIKRDFYVPRQGMVEKDFGCNIKLTAYLR